MEHIRNFCIIAHVDHGKSTLADRFLELTGTIEKRAMQPQFLDMNPLEQERGITIKMQPVRMVWKPGRAEIRSTKSEIRNNNKIQNSNVQNSFEFRDSDFEFSDSAYTLNLIDTPGHSDFSYEVSRALAAVEGAILLVDATQGVQAQTVSNLHAAQKQGLRIIPAINKIDLPSADIEKCEAEIQELLGGEFFEPYRVSAKEGTGASELLRGVIEWVPPPHAAVLKFQSQPLRALVFDSKYDPYLGVIAYVRVFDGAVKKGDEIFFFAAAARGVAQEVGIFSPMRVPRMRLSAGEIGYIATGIKKPELVRVGDTISAGKPDSLEPLPGYREPQPVVFASIFPENQDAYEDARDALAKLRLEDAAFTFDPEDAGPLGRGFRAGFLGLLHMEIVSERLRREYNLSCTFSHPSVAFRLHTKAGGEARTVYSASRVPDAHEIERIEEPYAALDILAPASFLGELTRIIHTAEGTMRDTATVSGDRLRIRAEAPLRRIIVGLYDTIKSASHGYGSFSYEILGWRASDLCRLDIFVSGERVPEFSQMVPRNALSETARSQALFLKELLPRQLFPIAVQGVFAGRVIARETVPALKKDVAGYLYGGDRSRKMKLWKKQKRGKKRLRAQGRVEIPPEVFLKMIRPRQSE